MAQLAPKVKFQVIKRDKFTCQYCGKKPPEVVLHIEHKKAISNGGGNELSNLITSCRECNLGKYAEDYKEKYSESKTLIKRTYRISLENETKIKKLSESGISESEVIRRAVSAFKV